MLNRLETPLLLVTRYFPSFPKVFVFVILEKRVENSDNVSFIEKDEKNL